MAANMHFWGEAAVHKTDMGCAFAWTIAFCTSSSGSPSAGKDCGLKTRMLGGSTGSSGETVVASSAGASSLSDTSSTGGTSVL